MKRTLALVTILVVGVFSLPLAALPIGDGGEGWIPVIAFVGSAIIGAVVWSLGASPATPPLRRALAGAAFGLLATVVGFVIFWLLLSGLHGA